MTNIMSTTMPTDGPAADQDREGMREMIARGELEQALLPGLRALERVPGVGQAVELASLLVDLRLPRVAKTIVSESLAEGSDSVALSILLARCQLMLGQVEEAATTLDALGPDHADLEAVRSLRGGVDRQRAAAA
ncbi:tetratricopeptide repeat protein [Roseomonas sp. CCTCC AB2023176]|uniref:tetratricopeptide repeat protein n=1 Tax=Roseomonas sp. CCTCC AB2023176 TaxID=3342640 RepID=UPI0035DE04B0